MSKINLGVIFGGTSTEHEVSMVSGQSVVEHLDSKKYNIYPIYIDKTGKWYEYRAIIGTAEEVDVSVRMYNRLEIKNIINYLKELDIVFPILHGQYGEDGSIQGMLKMLQIPYVGCDILASSIAMDKVYTKIILDRAEIKQANYCFIKKCGNCYKYVENNFETVENDIEKICKKVIDNLGLPVFIKASRYKTI